LVLTVLIWVDPYSFLILTVLTSAESSIFVLMTMLLIPISSDPSFSAVMMLSLVRIFVVDR